MSTPSVQEEKRYAFYRGVRASIQWLHDRAKEMNDPNAVSVLNSAAFNLGVDKPNPQDQAAPSLPQVGGEDGVAVAESGCDGLMAASVGSEPSGAGEP
jgi:hypothetical protein